MRVENVAKGAIGSIRTIRWTEQNDSYVYTAVHMENVTAAEKDRLLTTISIYVMRLTKNARPRCLSAVLSVHV